MDECRPYNFKIDGYDVCKHLGVEFSVCESCANKLEAKDKILELGAQVRFWGEPLTELIKNKECLITV